MDRIAVIGNSCGGKSRLSRRLAARHDLPLYEVDAFTFQPDGTPVSVEAFRSRHLELIRQNRWIMDGVGLPISVPRRVSRATMIILIDLPLWVHCAFACERQVAWAAGTLEHPPGAITKPGPTAETFRIIFEFNQILMPRLRALCKQHEARGKQVVVIKSLAELDAFELDAAQAVEPAS